MPTPHWLECLPGDRSSITGRVILKIKKIVIDAALLNSQDYKVWIKGKLEQSRQMSSTSLPLGVVPIENKAFGSPSTSVVDFTNFFFLNEYWFWFLLDINHEGYLVSKPPK